MKKELAYKANWLAENIDYFERREMPITDAFQLLERWANDGIVEGHQIISSLSPRPKTTEAIRKAVKEIRQALEEDRASFQKQLDDL